MALVLMGRYIDGCKSWRSDEKISKQKRINDDKMKREDETMKKYQGLLGKRLYNKRFNTLKVLIYAGLYAYVNF